MHQYGPFLVIVPLSTITAWQTQFQAWAPDMNVVTYIGTAASREVIRNYEFGPTNKKLKMNVLLTTYELTLRDSKELADIKWQALAVDEVDPVCVMFAFCMLTIFLGSSFEKFGQPVV
jgi:chromodomain-helicase-DNA-binding protein 1